MEVLEELERMIVIRTMGDSADLFTAIVTTTDVIATFFHKIIALTKGSFKIITITTVHSSLDCYHYLIIITIIITLQ